MTDDQQTGDELDDQAPDAEPPADLDAAADELETAIADVPPSTMTAKVQAVIDAARAVVDRARELQAAAGDTDVDPDAEPARPFTEQSEVQTFLSDLGPEHRQLLAAGLSAFDDSSPQSSGGPDDATGGNYHPGADEHGVHRGADGVPVAL